MASCFLNTHCVALLQRIFCLLQLNSRWLVVNETQEYAPKCYMLMSHGCLVNPLLSRSPTLPFSISGSAFLSHSHKHTVAHMLTPALQFEAFPLEMSGCQISPSTVRVKTGSNPDKTFSLCVLENSFPSHQF